MPRFYIQVLFSFILMIVISQCRAGSPDTQTVSAFKEEAVALSCLNPNVTNATSCYRFRWLKYTTDTKQMKVIFEWPKKDQDAKRVTWKADENGQMCLFLEKLQNSDEGMYTYEIWQGWDHLVMENISLKVKDCKTLTVTAAPRSLVQLNCPVNITSEQQVPQNISWKMLQGSSPVSVDSDRVEINGSSLVIQSVITSDSRWYRCNYSLGQTQRCFDIKLLVQEVENTSVTKVVPVIATETQTEAANIKKESSKTLTAVVTSVIFGLIIIAALIGLVIYYRHKTQRVTQQPTNTVFVDDYETIDIAFSQDPPNQKVNSLYGSEDEHLHTFEF